MAKKNKEAIKANLALLKARFPNMFFDTKPLVPSIIDDMIIELGSDPLAAIVKNTMRHYLRTPKYLRNLSKRKWLRDIHGSKVRLITAEEKQQALTRLEQIEQRHSLANAEYDFAVALAKDSGIDFQKVELLEQSNKQYGKVLVITRKNKKIIDEA